jgi:beta-galactosidase
MKRFLISLFSLLSLCGSAQHKSRISFNEGWKFRLDSMQSFSDPLLDDHEWRTLQLPHDWSIEGAFSKDHPAGTGGGALPGGIGWYRKTFIVPHSQKDKEVFIEFDGVYRNSEVFINGHSLGVRPNGYISFRYDLTPYLKFGAEKNVIAVKVDNSRQPNSRWYSGSGIYRNVWLTTLNSFHIDHNGTFVTTPEVNAREALIRVQTKAINGQHDHYWLTTTIYDNTGRKLLFARYPHPGDTTVQTFRLRNPKLWSVDKPNLYKVVTETFDGGILKDTYVTTFGIRSFYFDREKGFFLNGKPLKILGVCNHHDLGALGAAINARALERQLQILKDMGCNGIRTAHNPPAPELLDLADKMGFIVMDESFDMWAKSKSPYDYHLYWNEWHKKDLEDFILRDRNHPSVFIWSVGNEIGEQWGDAAKGDSSGRDLARSLVAIVRSLDTTRPITTANNEVNHWNNLIQSGAFDLVGYNYNHKRWGNFLKDWPGKKLIVTESTSALQTRGHYDHVPYDTIRRWPQSWDKPLVGGNPNFTVSAYDHVSAPWGSTHEESIRELKKLDHVSGMYIWTGFDYLGEPTPYPWPARSSYFGIIDLAGFPKDVYYLYQSEFTKNPVLHLFPHWNWRTGDTVDVVAYYSQADKVELFLNGKSLGVRSKSVDTLHVKWRVPFSPGVLKAVSSRNNKGMLSKEIKTAGPAYRLVMKADRNIIRADNRDLSFVTVEIRDRNGVLVPDAENLIQFSIIGPGSIAGVDNGSPVSLESFHSNQHTAMAGKVLCIVQSKKEKGSIRLTAGSPGLQSSTIIINAK